MTPFPVLSACHQIRYRRPQAYLIARLKTCPPGVVIGVPAIQRMIAARARWCVIDIAGSFHHSHNRRVLCCPPSASYVGSHQRILSFTAHLTQISIEQAK